MRVLAAIHINWRKYRTTFGRLDSPPAYICRNISVEYECPRHLREAVAVCVYNPSPIGHTQSNADARN